MDLRCASRLGGLAGLLLALLTLAAPAPGWAQPQLIAIAPATPGQLPLGDQFGQAVGEGDGERLVVWADSRSNVTGLLEGETSYDIFAQRLDLQGAPVGPVIPVCMAAGAQGPPRVAWSGSAWLVVFPTPVVGGTGGYYDTSLGAVRVGPQGEVLDGAPIIFHGVTGASLGHWVLGTEDGWIVIYQGTSTAAPIGYLRVARDGAVLDPPTRALVPDDGVRRIHPRVARAGGVNALVWEEGAGSYALRFDDALDPLGGPDYLGDFAPVGLAPGGDDFMVLWQKEALVGDARLFATTFDREGQVAEAPVEISVGHGPLEGSAAHAAWDGERWWVSWTEDAGARVARVSAALAVLDPGGRPLLGAAAGPLLPRPDGGVTLIYTRGAFYDDQEVLGLTVSPALEASDPYPVASGGEAQLGADLAWGPGGALATFVSATGEGSAAWAQALDSEAAPRGDPLRLSVGGEAGAPAVAWVGDHFRAVWAEGGQILSRRLDAGGAPLAAAPEVIMEGYGPVDIAPLGESALVVAFDAPANSPERVPYARRVGPGGPLGGGRFAVGESFGQDVRVTSLGSRWLVVNLRRVSSTNPTALVSAVFVGADGRLGEPFYLEGPGDFAGGNNIFTLGLAGGPGAALVVQSAELTSFVETDLMAQVVRPTGAVSEPINLTPWEGNQYRPEVAYGDGGFVVAFQDQRHRDTVTYLDELDARGDLMAMRVGLDGAPLDPDAFALSTSPHGETAPTVTCWGGDCLFAASILGGEGQSYEVRAASFEAMFLRPVALMSASPAEGELPLAVAFSAQGSASPEGGALSYAWDFGDGAAAAGASPAHTFEEPGPFTVSLVATDAAGRATRGTLSVDPRPVNQAPIAVAAADVTAGPAPLTVHFSAAGSYDPDGMIGDTRWDFDGGAEPSSSGVLTRTFTLPGSYLATLTVSDAAGEEAQSALLIEVSGGDQPPTAVLYADPTHGVSPLTVYLSAALSTDPEGQPLTYSWAFSDGTAAEGSPVYHTFFEAGVWRVELTARDPAGGEGVAEVEIVVEEEAPQGCESRGAPGGVPAGGGALLWLALGLAGRRRR